MASTGALEAWYAQKVPGEVDSIQAAIAPEYEPPERTHGAFPALLLWFVSNGRSMVLATFTKSARAFFRVSCCRVSALRSS
jgi:hypothetical protein